MIVPLKWMEYEVYGDLTIVYPEPYSIYLRGTPIYIHIHIPHIYKSIHLKPVIQPLLGSI